MALRPRQDPLENGIVPYPTALGGDLMTPRSLMELGMVALSSSIRSKPDWWMKYEDNEIRAKWRAEALATTLVWITGYNMLLPVPAAQSLLGTADMDEDLLVRLSERQVDYVLDELDGYAKLRDEQSGMQVSCFDGIWECDRLMPDDLRDGLLSEVATVLEDVPDDKKDWHPGSDNLVLDLVHPSMYCLIYGRTPAYPADLNGPRSVEALTIIPAPAVSPWPRGTSTKYAWLPTDFQVSEDGAVSALGYINNLHPMHTALYALIERALGAFVPMFERVLTDLMHALPFRIPGDYMKIEDTDPRFPKDVDRDDYYEQVEAFWKEWEKARYVKLPDVSEEGYLGGLEERTDMVSLRGEKMQVIVKLANIHLTPETPEYKGGSWHVEGMTNECIVSSGIYYYDQENITESELAFRAAVREPDSAMPQADTYDYYAHLKHFGFEYNGESGPSKLNQCVGAVKTRAGRCIAFPNTYQHKVSSFKLIDPTRPGHRKILAFFLVDPNIQIPSTTRVPPQQLSWARDALVNSDANSRIRMLPLEMIEWTGKFLDYMTEQEAKQVRLELMKERTAFLDYEDANPFETYFNLCEH